MSTFMLAKLRLKYGIQNLNEYNEAMKGVRDFFEKGGARLVHGLVTRVGPLYEVWNLWEVEDQGHIERIFEKSKSGQVELHHIASHMKLQEIVIEEEVRFLEALPFSLEDGR